MKVSRVGWLVGSMMLVSACGGSAQFDGGPEGEAGSGGRKSTPVTPIPSAGAPPAAGGAPGATRPEAGAPSVGGSSAQAGGGGITVCVVGEQTYAVGASWKCDCNTCYCGTDGKVASTAVACFACTYAGIGRFAGTTFPSTDGCNSCQCAADGSVACTDKACGCSADKPWNKQYAGSSPEQCALIDYECGASTKPFSDGCGCGCEQDASCAEWIDCSPGTTSCASMKQKCPLSQIAY